MDEDEFDNNHEGDSQQSEDSSGGAGDYSQGLDMLTPPGMDSLKSKGKNAVSSGIGKFKSKIGGKAKKAAKSILAKIAPLLIKYLLIAVGIFVVALCTVLLCFSAWDLVLNSRGKTQDMQTENTQEYNDLQISDTGIIEASNMSFGNKIVYAFYTYFAEQSLYVIVEDEGVNEPLQYNSKEFIKKFGEEDVRTFRDKFNREKNFYINPQALWVLDEFINETFAFPEQWIKPVYNTGIDGDEDFSDELENDVEDNLEEGNEGSDDNGVVEYDDTPRVGYDNKYDLKDLVDETGTLVAMSTKYEYDAELEEYKPLKINENGPDERSNYEETEGVWDYGFGSILYYSKFIESSKRVGTYDKIELWDSEEGEVVLMTLEEAENADKDRYQGYYDASGEFEETMEGETDVYMIGKVTGPAGSISNTIIEQWRDTGEAFTTEESRVVKVTKLEMVTKESSESKSIDINPGETAQVVTRINLDGSEVIGSFINQDSEIYTKEYELITEYEEEDSVERDIELKVFVNGTVYKREPMYEGTPNTDKITGSKYYRDYLSNYKTYAPRSVLTSFNFDDMRSRTGKDFDELLELLEREPFGEQSGAVEVDIDFEVGSGASSGVVKNALQYFHLFEKYGETYGVDPYMLVAKAAQESQGKHDNLISSNRCRIAGCGIMQIEKPGITITSASAYNHQTGQTDTFSVSHASVSNLEENIKIGTMLYANRVALQGYHMILGLQSYNFGTGGTNAVLKVYEEATGKSPDAVRADHSDLGWLSYTAEVHQNPKRYFTWNENQSVMCSQEACTNKGLGHFGDISYVSNVLRYYVNPTGTTWAKSKDGALYEMNLGEAGMNIGTSSGVPSTGGSASHKGWLGRLWDKLMDAWKTLFPLIPDELPIERLPFSAYPRDHQIDTIIKMMFAMDEQKYLTEYNDFDEEAFKEKYKELFSNAFGGTNGSNNDIANALFPNGFEKPINIKPATISKDYDGTNIEYVALNGTEVFAVSSGEVVEVSSSSIKIKHDGDVYTIYTYVSNSLSVGDKVDKGEQIGTTIDGKFGIGLLKGDSNINGSWLVEDSFDFTDYNMTEEDAKIIQAVISLGKTKIGGVYTQDLNRRNGPDTFDCSGFTRYIYEQITGVNIGANTTGQYNILKNYQVQGGLSNAQPGDLILASGRHVMVYLGNMQVLHASNSKPWPAGGIKENGINRLEHDEIIVRPIAYINSVKGN